MKSIKKLMVIIASALIMVAPSIGSAADLDTASLEGTWVNADPNSRSVVEIIITNDGGLQVQAFGACTPTPCDWGVVPGIPYGVSVSATRAKSFTAVYDHGFAERIMTGCKSGRHLNLKVFTKFTDGSGRSNYSISGTFVRP